MNTYSRFALALAAAAAFCGFAVSAHTSHAASLKPDSSVTLTIPDGWESSKSNYGSTVPGAVSDVFDCVSRNPSEVKIVAWKLQDTSLEGAYCVTYQKSGMGRVREILKTTTGAQREQAAGKVMDAFAGEVQGGMTAKGLTVQDMNADIIEAGKDILVVVEGKGSAGSASYVRSATMILHGDALLTIGALHSSSASDDIVKQLDGIAGSVKWKR